VLNAIGWTVFSLLAGDPWIWGWPYFLAVWLGGLIAYASFDYAIAAFRLRALVRKAIAA
jgi:hypothetical protein